MSVAKLKNVTWQRTKVPHHAVLPEKGVCGYVASERRRTHDLTLVVKIEFKLLQFIATVFSLGSRLYRLLMVCAPRIEGIISVTVYFPANSGYAPSQGWWGASMNTFSCNVYVPPPARHGSIRSESFSARACLARLRKRRAGSVRGGIVWTNLCNKSIPGSASELRLRSIYRREIIRGGRSCEVNITTGVDGRSVVKLIAAATKVRGVNQGAAGGVQLGHEDVVAASIDGLERIQCRKIRRGGVSANIGVAIGVSDDLCSVVISVAPKVGGINQASAAGVDFRHKCVWAGGIRAVTATDKVSLESSRCRGEVSGERKSRNVSIAREIDRGSPYEIEVVAAQVCRIDQIARWIELR
jgi:hypothetical protein